MQLKDIKTIKRFKDIVAILAKYGFDEIVDRFDLPGGDFLRQVSPVEEDMSVFERIQAVLEELGPTYIKFGQVMSLRPDLLPEELLQNLANLQDNVTAVAAEEITPVIEKNLGRPIAEVFSEFNFESAAAASLSQVHRAVMKSNGSLVAVKVQRPGIQDDVASDLDILESISDFLDQQFEDMRSYQLPELVRTVRKTLMKELDFNIERSNMDIARSYAENTDVVIPKTYPELSSEKLLVMDYFDGAKFRDIVNRPMADRERVAREGLHAAVKQILEDGFFHADPHPGNLMVSPDLGLCFIDWGMVGRLTEKDRFMLISLLSAVVDKDSRAIMQSFLRLCEARAPVDEEAMQRDLLDLLDRYHAVPIKEMNIGQFMMGLLTLLRDHQLQLPIDLVIMIKALITADGSARLAYPDLNVVDAVKDHVHSISRERYHPSVIWRSFKDSLVSFWTMQEDLPRQLHHIIKMIEQGELSVIFRLEKLEELVSTLENASNRLTIGIVTGAIIMGSSMIITTGVRPFLFGLPALGVLGYLLSVILGLWLVITILRNKKI